ncbi:hypothetical protein JCM1840_001295 [Sporobolomyces johnsonii]
MAPQAPDDSFEFVLLSPPVSPESPPSAVLSPTVVSPTHSPPIPSSASSSPGPATHRRFKRSTPVELSPQSIQLELPSSPESPFTRSRSASSGRERTSSGSPSRVPLARTRLVITKTHCQYDHPMIPFRSALVGFRANFHSPPSSSSRVRNAEITLRFHGVAGPAPVIKAIAPSSMGVGPVAEVERTISTTGGLHLGYSYGKLELSRTASRTYTHTTQATINSSGVETSDLWLTLDEDPVTKQGVPQSIDFAVLLYLPSSAPAGFEVDLR